MLSYSVGNAVAAMARRSAIAKRTTRNFSSQGPLRLDASNSSMQRMFLSLLVGGSAAASVVYMLTSNPTMNEAAAKPNAQKDVKKEASGPFAFFDELKEKIFGDSNVTGDAKARSTGASTSATTTTTTDDLPPIRDSNTGKVYQNVDPKLDPEVVAELPIVSLAEVREADGLGGEGQKLLATYQGIVYDVTEFANHHPGGRDLLRTAAGMDLKHFFENYTVHGLSEKAANWLALLAVGKLSDEEAAISEVETTPDAHVKKRHEVLTRARRKVLVVASTLPLWMVLRTVIRFIGSWFPSLGRLLARAMPVTVPGYSRGAERLEPMQVEEVMESVPDGKGGFVLEPKKVKKDVTVAVIGGGVAGCGTAWSLHKSGFKVTLFEARPQISGNARTFDWDFSPFKNSGHEEVKSCVSVTAWPSLYYKNYTALLKELKVETIHQPLSWFLVSKVPGCEGNLWGADPRVYEGSLRKVFEKDFKAYSRAEKFARLTTDIFCLNWAPWKRNDEPSMYANHTGLGLLNPFNIIPLHTLFKAAGGSELWWDVIFTPYYTASFLVDELRPFPAVFGPLIEAQIPLLPNEKNTWQGSSHKSETDCNITTCVTWKDAGKGIREVFGKLVAGVDVKDNLRVREVVVLDNGKKRVYDEHDGFIDVDRVVFACPANAIGNMLKKHGALEEIILNTPVYADDHHPSTGHMHAVMHSDASVIPEEFRKDVLTRASNYVEVTRTASGEINMENQYNFGVQTPGGGVSDLPIEDKPVMLISHALGEGKSIDRKLIRGTGNHARAHPLYSGWNVMAMLSLRLVQGKDGVYYCSNWTTPGNCHDMSLLSGLVCAHAIGADYPFEDNSEAKKDFHRLRDLMGV